MSLIKTQEISLIAKTALPLMAAFLAQKGMQLIDTLMMGWIGPQALAAGALGTSIFTTALIFCMGTLSAVGIFIARARGANQDYEISSNLQHGVLLALLLSVPCMILIWYAPYLLTKIGEDAIIVANTTLLLHGLIWGFPGFLLFLVYREFISAFTLTRIVMVVTLCSIPLTFITNYIFIYGKYGFPALGIAGIGYAGAGIMWFMFCCLFFYGRKHPELKVHTTAKVWVQIEALKIGSLFALGAPSGLLYVLDMGLFLFAAIMMGRFGVDALAAHQIAVQCATIAYSVPFGLSMATALLVGHAVGSNDVLQAKRLTYISLSLGLLISGLIALIFAFIPEILSNLFLNHNEPHLKLIHQIAASFLSVAALFQCFDALQTILNGSLRGFKDTLVPMLLCVSCYWILGIGGAYYLAFYTHFAAIGIWYGLTLGICSAGVVLMMRFLLRKKQYPLAVLSY